MNRQSGLTLIEMMVTVVVMLVLVFFGVPLFQNLQANNRITAQANQLVTALQTARSEAVRRAATVTLCPKASPFFGFTNCGDADDWAQGFQVFVDGDAAGDRDGSDTDLRTFPELTGAPVVTASADYVQFTGTGEQSVNGLPTGAEVTVQLARPGTSAYGTDRCVRVSVMGQVRVHQVGDTLTCP